MTVLSTRGLTWRVGEVSIVDTVSLDLAPGEFLAVIGPNGAGKTSLFNLISGLTRPSAGSVHLDGADVTGLTPYRRARLGLGRTFQSSSVFASLSVTANVALAVQARRGGSMRLWPSRSTDRSVNAEASAVLDRVGLGPRATALAGTLAHGEKRKLEIALLLAGQPKVLLLDEPMAGVSAEDVPALVDLVRGLTRDDGHSVLMVEHHMEVVLDLADRVAVMHHGAVLICDTPAAVMADPTVQEAYLGGATMTALLSIADLRVRIGGSHILQGVGFSVPPTGITVLLGRNGVGKTTTLLAVLGMLPPAAQVEGQVTFDGAPLGGSRTHRIIRQGLGYVPEDRRVFGGLTVAENLRLAERRDHPADYDTVYALFPELAKRARQRAGTLSGGQQQMVALARVLLNRNRLLLVDEPTKGLAPRVVTEVADVLERVAQTVPVLLVEQNLAVVRRLGRDAVVLSAGQVAFTGPLSELLDDPARTQALLGVGQVRVK